MQTGALDISRGKDDKKNMHKVNLTAVITAIAIIVMLVLPALAQARGRGTPAPLLGAGLPMLVLVGGGYLIVRRLRRPAN